MVQQEVVPDAGAPAVARAALLAAGTLDIEGGHAALQLQGMFIDTALLTHGFLLSYDRAAAPIYHICVKKPDEICWDRQNQPLFDGFRHLRHGAKAAARIVKTGGVWYTDIC